MRRSRIFPYGRGHLGQPQLDLDAGPLGLPADADQWIIMLLPA